MPFLLGIAAAIALGADADLAKAVQAVADAGRYGFTVREDGAAGAVEGVFQRGVPLYVKADGIEFFRQDNVLVYRDGGGWQRTRTGTLSDPLRILAASGRVRAVHLPHAELARLIPALHNVACANGKAEILIGTFGPAAARELARIEDRELAQGGTARLWLHGQGRLTRYEISIQLRGRRGNADVDGTAIKTVTMSEVGTATVEIPAEAKKALE